MPTFEMPFAELEKYQGCNPRPVDFDQYWDNALQEMKDTDPCVTLVPSEFQAPNAECYDLYFTGVRKARIHAKYLKPTNFPEPHPAVIQFHGYSCNSGDWCDRLNFVGAGISVLSMDCRGQGGLSEDTGGVKGNTLHGHIIRGLDDAPENLLFRHIFLDTAELAAIIMDFPEVDPNRVGVTGWSQGGGLTLACAALEPRIKRVAPCYPFLCDYRRVWDMDLAKDAYAEIRDYFRLFDPTHAREKEVFTRLGYIDVQHLAGRIRGEVMFATGLMDTICPPSTQFAAYNKIKAPKQMVVYPDFTHEGLPGMNDTLFQFMLGL